jgi:2-keto-4-pentenoate hydratase/2-oxohepta-3-ene-1,7-dioic acid hydratase in catechol pathway
MKLVAFGGGRIGIVRPGGVLDVTESLGVEPGEWPPVGMLRVIRDFDRHRDFLGAASGPLLSLDDIRLEAPIVWPNKLLAYPVNYFDHQAEMQSPNRADWNGFFLKAASSISGPRDPIVLPNLPNREIHHECELAIVIGRGGRDIDRDSAMDHVFGYACLIDVTVRGREERVMRKSHDTFTPIGPWIVTADEVPDPANLDLRLWVNDDLRQSANTRDMILDIPAMVVVASSVSELQPGDIIASGTPAGVGPIVAGDRVRIEIQHIGSMTVPVEQSESGGNSVYQTNDKRAAAVAH